MRKLALPAVLALLAAACSGSGTTTTAAFVPAPAQETSTTTSTSPPPPSTTLAPATTATTEPSTTTTVAGGSPEFAVTQISFGENGYVEISNVGTGPGNVAGHWLCQRPSYFELPAADLMPGESIWVATGDGAALLDSVGLVVTSVVAAEGVLGSFTAGRGEIALYVDSDFANPGAIRDFVAWAAVGALPGLGRASVAVDAGIWQPGDLVGVPAEATGLTPTAVPSLGAGDWLADVGG